jgi:AcrR family transcriptional regulator
MTLHPPDLRLPAPPDQKQSEILDAIRASFIEKGFDGASMQDLARAAGMSVGNFYRYFPSKDAIIAAIVMRDLACVQAEFAAIIGSDDALAMLRSVIGEHISGVCHADGCNTDSALWAEITAAARRKPEIGAVLANLEGCIRSYLITVFAMITLRTQADAAGRYGGHASLIIMLITASGMRAPDDAWDDLNPLVMRIIDQTLAEIAQDVAKE